jgi:hypothetical protein
VSQPKRPGANARAGTPLVTEGRGYSLAQDVTRRTKSRDMHE